MEVGVRCLPVKIRHYVAVRLRQVGSSSLRTPQLSHSSNVCTTIQFAWFPWPQYAFADMSADVRWQRHHVRPRLLVLASCVAPRELLGMVPISFDDSGSGDTTTLHVHKVLQLSPGLRYRYLIVHMVNALL
jgi:hypothetical protein